MACIPCKDLKTDVACIEVFPKLADRTSLGSVLTAILVAIRYKQLAVPLICMAAVLQVLCSRAATDMGNEHAYYIIVGHALLLIRSMPPNRVLGA